MKKPSPNLGRAGSAGMTTATTNTSAIRMIRAAAAYANAWKIRSPEMSRRWRLVATSGVGTTRSVAVPRLISASGRRGGAQGGGGSRGDGLQRRNILSNDVRRQLRVVHIDRIRLALGDEPVEEAAEGSPLGLSALTF